MKILVRRIGAKFILERMRGSASSKDAATINGNERVVVMAASFFAQRWRLLCLSRSSLPSEGRITVPHFGVLGLGSILYLVYGLHSESSDDPAILWAKMSPLAVSSVAAHSALASPVIRCTSRGTRDDNQPLP